MQPLQTTSKMKKILMNKLNSFFASDAFGRMAVASCLLLTSGDANAAGGTATPPAPGTGTPPALATQAPPVPNPVFSAPMGQIHGFTTVGFIQNATVSGANCPSLDPAQWGGTAVINGLTITIPCNTILQMPAATFTWADLFNPAKFKSAITPPADLSLPTSGGTFGNGTFAFPSTEIRIDGNIVAGQYIAGLVYISQQSLNSGTGYITGFDYPKGVIFVGKTPGGPATARLQLNDANGRFSAGQSPDSRFNVDDQNPTIHAITGYPMCVPRTDPATADDPLCPQRNRPTVDVNGNGCRNFSAAGFILPTGRELAPPVPGQKYCTAFVMKAPPGTPVSASLPAFNIATPAEPDSRQQAPFEIGDLITWSGTLLEGSADGPNGTDTIAVHTINANLGIYTHPGTLPVYLALGEFSVSADAPSTVLIEVEREPVGGGAVGGVGAGAGAGEAPPTFNGIPQEAHDRLVLDAFVTDVTSIVDIYLVDRDPVTGEETQRWVSPATMTGGVGSVGSNGTFIDGGITTQLSGAVPGRVRERANKATPGILVSPTRNIRVVARSLCDPANINGTAPLIGIGGAPVSPISMVPCLKRAPAANGLFTGQYEAPEFTFIFPENVVAGDPVVPYNLWSFGFLVNGEGPGTGPLIPTPW